MRELVSVIVPIYNAERYMKPCIDSIRNQSYGNIEIILVDDGSTDGGPSICDAYEQSDSRIRVIHKKNGGVSSARNAGLDMAKGVYITFVDADDTINDKMIEKMVWIFKNHLVELTVCGFSVVGQNGTIARTTKDRELILTEEEALCNIFEDYDFQMAIWNKIYLRSIIEKNKIRFQEQITHGEDGLWLCTYLCKCKQVYWTGKSYYQYLQVEDSAMNKMQSSRKFDYRQLSVFESLDKTLPVIKEKDKIVLDAFGAHYAGIAIGLMIFALRFAPKDRKLINDLKEYIKKYRKSLLKSFKYSNKDKILAILLSTRPGILKSVLKG